MPHTAGWRFGFACFLALAASLGLPNAAMGQEDTTPPTLHALSCNPAAIDVTGGPQTVTCTVTITDDLSGVAAFPGCGPCMNIFLQSPSAGQDIFATFQHTSGDQYEAQLTIPQFAEAGAWRPRVDLADRARNTDVLFNSELQAMGIDVTVEVNANDLPDCSGVTATPRLLWPPSHKLRSVSLSGATDPDGDAVTLTVTGVTQDEPLNGLGRRHFARRAGGHPVEQGFPAP